MRQDACWMPLGRGCRTVPAGTLARRRSPATPRDTSQAAQDGRPSPGGSGHPCARGRDERLACCLCRHPSARSPIAVSVGGGGSGRAVRLSGAVRCRPWCGRGCSGLWTGPTAQRPGGGCEGGGDDVGDFVHLGWAEAEGGEGWGTQAYPGGVARPASTKAGPSVTPSTIHTPPSSSATAVRPPPEPRIVSSPR